MRTVPRSFGLLGALALAPAFALAPIGVAPFPLAPPAAAAAPSPAPAPSPGLAPSPALAPAPARPRQVADRVAAQIEAGYFDPAKGARTARDLRAEAARGRFDAFTDPRDLATALTDWLRPRDAHFGVTFDAMAAAAPAARGAAPAPFAPPPPLPKAALDRMVASMARANFGFTRVEILPGAVGYIRMDGFFPIDPDDADDPARRAADAALAVVANARALIIDLRQNNGGAPAMVGYMAANFVPAGADVYNTFKTRGADARETPPFPPSRPPRLDTPLFILTSARTISAAESLPYTLQAAKRAVIVGETTAGGANPGGPRDAGGGFSVFVSFGSPINPITHANWEGTGVRPDVAVPADQALTRAHALALQANLQSADADLAEESRWVLETLSPHAPDQDLAALAGAYAGFDVAVQGPTLVARRGRQPPMTLVALDRDLFFAEGQPLRRLRFERDASGRVVALTLFGPGGGPEQRFARQP